MKISNSKKQLAEIIHENGGWRDEAKFSVQDKDGQVFHYASRPIIGAGAEVWGHKGCIGYGEFEAKTLPNWHQTILLRDEYLHLYPGAETAPAPVVEVKPTIEQLAADYRNRKDYADRKQQEADAAKADAEAKLTELVATGKAHGLVLSVVGVAPEPELVNTDWRDWQVGDEVELISFQGGSAKVGEVGAISKVFGDGAFHVDFPSQSGYSVDHSHIKFIRRHAKGGDNA